MTTLCNCQPPCKETSMFKSGYPTNMSVPNCDFSSFDCVNEIPFKSSIEPGLDKNLFQNLNPRVYTDAYAKDFSRVSCERDKGCKTVYASSDPRLVSSSHNGQVLTLDRPPIDDSMQLKDICSDKNLNCYGQNYRNYFDVNAGQIMYYVDGSISDPFFTPVFSTQARVFSTVYKDPMGSLKPHYYREPLKCNNPLDTTHDTYVGGLSWMQDSDSFREDIMSKQMSRINQQRYEPRWS